MRINVVNCIIGLALASILGCDTEMAENARSLSRVLIADSVVEVTELDQDALRPDVNGYMRSSASGPEIDIAPFGSLDG